MKGIIVAKNSESSVLLLSDGTFKTVKTLEGFEVGMVLMVNDAQRPRSYYWKKIASMAASVIVVAFIGLGTFLWSTPAQFINIDINPSVELSVNYFDRIISVNPMNEDGQKLVESVSVQACRYESGIELVISTAQEMGYLNDEEDVLISISSSDQKRVEKAKNDIIEKVSPSMEILTFDTEQREQSIQKGISPGRENIIEKVIEIGTDIDKEELTEKPVKELMKIIKENKKTEQEEEKGAKENNKKRNDNSADKQDEKNKNNVGNDERDKPDKGKDSSNKPEKGNANNDKPGKGNDNNNKPGKENDNSDKPDKRNDKSKNQGKGNDNSEKPGKGIDKIINLFRVNNNKEKPDKENDKTVNPGKGNDNSDKPGKGNENDNKPGKNEDNSDKPGKGNNNDNKPGKGSDNNNKSSKGNDNFNESGKENDNSVKPGKGNDKKVNPNKGNNNSNKPDKGNDKKVIIRSVQSEQQQRQTR
jgi:hypothetical protein